MTRSTELGSFQAISVDQDQGRTDLASRRYRPTFSLFWTQLISGGMKLSLHWIYSRWRSALPGEDESLHRLRDSPHPAVGTEALVGNAPEGKKCLIL